MATGGKKRISFDEINARLVEGVTGADAQRADSLERLANFRLRKAAMQEREAQRIKSKTGADDERVLTLQERRVANVNLASEAYAEVESIRTPEPDKERGEWVVYGHVRDSARRPVTNVSVVLHGDPGALGKSLATTKSDKSGYFEMAFPEGHKALAKFMADPPDTSETETEGNSEPEEEKAVYLFVQNGRGTNMLEAPTAVTPVRNARDYQQLIVATPGRDAGPPIKEQDMPDEDELQRLYQRRVDLENARRAKMYPGDERVRKTVGMPPKAKPVDQPRDDGVSGVKLDERQAPPSGRPAASKSKKKKKVVKKTTGKRGSGKKKKSKRDPKDK